jgi:ABC-type dipeptide/oligopeptide/nickel transport system permease subunit
MPNRHLAELNHVTTASHVNFHDVFFLGAMLAIGITSWVFNLRRVRSEKRSLKVRVNICAALFCAMAFVCFVWALVHATANERRG